MRLRALAVASTALLSSLEAAPTGTNLGFESGLTGWTHSSVALETTEVHEGTQALDLQSGWIEQTITGLTPGVPHTLELAYLDATPEGYIQGHAQILVDGNLLTEIHNGQENEFLDGIGFEFSPTSSQATLRIEALPGDSESFVIDDIRVTVAALPLPPVESWSNLLSVADARGGRRLVNGTFETTIGPAANDPYNSGPDGGAHLCRFSLPGWLVTKENVDLVNKSTSQAPEGDFALDLGGHGPGGIAQTIDGLTPGAVYTVSFQYAGHSIWFFSDSDVMTGELFANDQLISQLSRTSDQTWDDGYDLFSIPLLASPSGEITLKIRSTTTNRGGNILYDDIRLSEEGDAFLAWTLAEGVAADPDANPDSDAYTHEFEFLLGFAPLNHDSAIVPTLDAGQRILAVPLTGAALDQGYQLGLQASTDLSTWASASTYGVTILDDSSSTSSNGTRRYLLPDDVDSLFLQLVLTRP